MSTTVSLCVTNGYYVVVLVLVHNNICAQVIETFSTRPIAGSLPAYVSLKHNHKSKKYHAREKIMSDIAVGKKATQAIKQNKINNVVFKNYHAEKNNDIEEVLSGLQRSQKNINPKFFYDTYGSELFEKITHLPEYYPTRTERSILTQNAEDIAKHCGQDCILIEPGSGSSEKIRLLLNDIKPQAYVPMDIAGDFLHESAIKLGQEFPWLQIHAICADFSQEQQAPTHLPEGKRVIFYPGSTLGNMTPEKALIF